MYLFPQELAEDVLMTQEQGEERTGFLAAAGTSRNTYLCYTLFYSLLFSSAFFCYHLCRPTLLYLILNRFRDSILYFSLLFSSHPFSSILSSVLLQLPRSLFWLWPSHMHTRCLSSSTTLIIACTCPHSYLNSKGLLLLLTVSSDLP